MARKVQAKMLRNIQLLVFVNDDITNSFVDFKNSKGFIPETQAHGLLNGQCFVHFMCLCVEGKLMILRGVQNMYSA